MSALLTDDDLITKREPVKAPAKAWRNHFRVHIAPGAIVIVKFDGQPVTDGHVVVLPDVFPSKEIAEQKALDDLAAQRGLLFALSMFGFELEYLGAFPDEASA